MSPADPSSSTQPNEPWYAEAFGKDYLHRYAHRSNEAAAGDIPFLVEALNLQAGDWVLDLCCGAGRYSSGLASTGLNILGVDLSRDLLRKAANDAPSIPFMRCDMRTIPIADASLDGVVNLFTSFGSTRTKSIRTYSTGLPEA